jgi:CMP/dCMP kinase
MIITIGGFPGSGKGTVGKLLAQKLNYKYFSMGDMWGEMAKKSGMTLNEFFAAGKEDPTFNNKLDAYQRQLGIQDNIIVDSRLGFHFIPHATKVYLSVRPDIGAQRIFSVKNRDDEHYTSLEEAQKEVHERFLHEKDLYSHLYNVNPHDAQQFDIVVDTTTLTPEEVVEKILAKVKKV